MMLESNMLESAHIRLTALEKEDLETIALWYEDTAFGRHFDAAAAYPRSLDQWAKWLEEQQKDRDNYIFAIRHIGEKRLLGYAQLDGILWTHQNCWLGLGLGDRQDWGKGYGRQAMELILKFAFDELNLHRIQLTVFSYNKRAISLYEGLGFTREGTYREFLQRDGQRYDMILFGLLRDEWEKTRLN